MWQKILYKKITLKKLIRYLSIAIVFIICFLIILYVNRNKKQINQDRNSIKILNTNNLPTKSIISIENKSEFDSFVMHSKYIITAPEVKDNIKIKPGHTAGWTIYEDQSLGFSYEFKDAFFNPETLDKIKQGNKSGMFICEPNIFTNSVLNTSDKNSLFDFDTGENVHNYQNINSDIKNLKSEIWSTDDVIARETVNLVGIHDSIFSSVRKEYIKTEIEFIYIHNHDRVRMYYSYVGDQNDPQFDVVEYIGKSVKFFPSLNNGTAFWEKFHSETFGIEFSYPPIGVSESLFFRGRDYTSDSILAKDKVYELNFPIIGLAEIDKSSSYGYLSLLPIYNLLGYWYIAPRGLKVYPENLQGIPSALPDKKYIRKINNINVEVSEWVSENIKSFRLTDKLPENWTNDYIFLVKYPKYENKEWIEKSLETLSIK